MSNNRPGMRRVSLKISGEALVGEGSFGIDPDVLKSVAGEIHQVHCEGVQIAIIIGGGNIFRGLHSVSYGLGRVPADHMGMLATVINAIALSEALNHLGSETRVMTAIDMNKIAEPYVQKQAIRHLEKGRIVLLGAGTGNPFFSTDTAAALRAMEIQAEALLKATKVDGVYAADPVKNPSLKPFDRLSYREVLERNLQVMDMTAVSLSMEQGLPIIVFNLRQPGNIRKVLHREKIGTLISGEEK